MMSRSSRGKRKNGLCGCGEGTQISSGFGGISICAESRIKVEVAVDAHLVCECAEGNAKASVITDLYPLISPEKPG
jgi:hypothetical protein